MKKLLLVLIALNLTACGFEIVDTGHRGIKTHFGEVVSDSLEEGLYFYNPITSDIKEMDVRVQKLQYKSTTYSKDAQIVEVTSTVNFHLVKNEAHLVYKEVGRDYDQKLLNQVVQGAIKEVTGKYEAVDLIANRQKATAEIRDLLGKRLLERRIVLTGYDVDNLDFDDQFEAAVKNKVIAVEQAKEAKNKTVRIDEEAKQRVITAKSTAEAMKVRARALTQNKALVEYEAVMKWDGKLPEIMAGSGTLPFINLKSKKQ